MDHYCVLSHASLTFLLHNDFRDFKIRPSFMAAHSTLWLDLRLNDYFLISNLAPFSLENSPPVEPSQCSLFKETSTDLCHREQHSFWIPCKWCLPCRVKTVDRPWVLADWTPRGEPRRVPRLHQNQKPPIPCQYHKQMKHTSFHETFKTVVILDF